MFFSLRSGYTLNPQVDTEDPNDPTTRLKITEFPEGAGEFLDAWLMLLEKMVNPKAVLESPHVVAPKPPTIINGKVQPHDPATPQPFDPIAYLVHVHRRAFDAVRRIWRIPPMKTYGPRMTESMLTIMKHIFKGEKVLRDRHAKRLATAKTAAELTQVVVSVTRLNTSGPLLQPQAVASAPAAAASSATAAAAAPVASTSSSGQQQQQQRAINMEDLQQLIDMGFPPRACREVLYHSNSVQQVSNRFGNEKQESF